MYATAQFRVAATANVPLVPDDALVFRNGNIYMRAVLNDRLHLTHVELGLNKWR